MHQLPTNIQSATRILAVAVLSVSLVLTLSLGIFYACDLLVAPVQLRLVSGRSADRVNCKAPAMVDWQMKLPHDLEHRVRSGEPFLQSAWRGPPAVNNDTLKEGGSQSQEDQYAYHHFFRNMWGGTYLEIGGLNGLLFSNTLWFHRYLGWRGILIEGSPKSYSELVRNRPYDICIQAAVCDTRTKVHYVHPPGDAAAVHGIYEFMTEKFKETWYKQLEEADKTEITCLPLADMLAHLHVRQIDFFSLDVEGGELGVLRSIDFDCTNFNVIVVEADATYPAKDAAVVALLQSKGYQYHGHVDRNDWFVRADWDFPQARHH